MDIPSSFLLDEVRCGFLIPSAIKQAWAAELEVLAEIDRVCRKHNIQYFADWGTLLGAVRHGGFIPWDDDLDIVMKREDYTKFMTVARFDMEEGFDVQTYRNQKDFWLFMGKVVGKNRFCFEKDHLRKFHNFPYIACVDIFVLDYVYPDPEKEEKRRTLCKYMLGVADAIVEGKLSATEQEKSLCIIEEMSGKRIKRPRDLVECRSSLTHHADVTSLEHESENDLDVAEAMGRYLYGEVEKIFGEVPEREATTLTQLFPWGLKGTGLQFPKEYYSEAIYLPFECTTMPVPKVYDKMLRMRYGDYMKLIRDAGAHNYPFFEGQKANLQKVLDFKLPEFEADVEKISRSEEEGTFANLSYKAMAKECVDALEEMRGQLLATVQQIECIQNGTGMWGALCENLVGIIQESQQLAIDLGTMLEQMLGEGTEIVGLLEQYCEVLYATYEWAAQGTTEQETPKTVSAKFHVLSDQITAELERILACKTVLFLPVLARDWQSLHGLWKAAAEDANCAAYVVPLPYYYKDYDSSPKEICCDAAAFPEEVCPMDYKGLTAEYLEMLHPDVIVIQNPYDAWNPAMAVADMYYSLNLRKYTEALIYVPPFALEEFTKDNARAYSNMKYYATMPGVVYADKVIAQSEKLRQVYIERLTDFVGEESREIWEEKVQEICVPEQDAEPEQAKQQSADAGKSKAPCKKRILYGISRGTYLEDPGAAEQKQERCLQIFEQYKESIEVDILHFPEDGIGIAEGYDAYYGDPMPVAVEFMQAGKPVMIQNINL